MRGGGAYTFKGNFERVAAWSSLTRAISDEHHFVLPVESTCYTLSSSCEVYHVFVGRRSNLSVRWSLSFAFGASPSSFVYRSAR